MDIEAEIAQKIRSEIYDPWDRTPEKIAAALMPLVKRAQSEAWERAHDCPYFRVEYHVEFCRNPYIEQGGAGA